MINRLQIITDSREKTPYKFINYPVDVTTGTLNSGDYSLAGFSDLVAVERKTLTDLISSISGERKRFTKELERLRGYDTAALVVECRWQTIKAGKYRSKMTPQAATQTLISFMAQYRLPCFFAEDARAGEDFTYNFLRHYATQAERRYKAIRGAEQ